MAERKETDFVVIHCSATKPDMDIGAKDIDRWHRQKGWRKIGYHYVIKRDGTIEEGRDLGEVGAHARGINSKSVGICMAGGIADDGKSEDNFTDEQWNALGPLVNQMKVAFPDAEVLGHRDLPNVAKDCPCFDVREWWKETEVTS